MSDLPAALGGAALPRPQRAGAVRMRSEGEALGDGADDLLVVLRAVVESQLALGPLPPAADGPRASISLSPLAAAEAALTCAAFVRAAAAVGARQGGVGVEPLRGVLEPLTRAPAVDAGRAAETSKLVIAELARAVRAEPEPVAAACVALLLPLLSHADGLQHARCDAALSMRAGLLAYAFEVIDRGDVSQLKEDVPAQGADPRVVQAHSDASRCYMVIRLVLELNQADGGAAGWIDAELRPEDVDAMVVWLKAASRTPALGKAAEKGRLFGIPKVRAGGKGAYERTTSQQWSLESLKALKEAKRR